MKKICNNCKYSIEIVKGHINKDFRYCVFEGTVDMFEKNHECHWTPKKFKEKSWKNIR